MAGHVFVVGAGSLVLGWVTDQGTVFVTLGILKSTCWGSNSSGADICGASSLGVALRGTHGSFNTSDGDVDFTGLAASWLEWIFEMAGCGRWCKQSFWDVVSFDHVDGDGRGGSGNEGHGGSNNDL